MGVFVYSKTQEVAKSICEMIEAPGFIFSSRGEMDLVILRHLSDVGKDIWPTYFTTLGSLAGSLDIHMELNEDDEVERAAKKMCATKKAWSYVKIQNGPRMNFVIGYSDCSPASPFAYSNTQMAQKGLIQTTVMPG